MGECSKDRTVGQMGGVRGRWKVKQTAGQAAMGQLREDTHLHRVRWPFPASQQVSTCPVVTELCANLTAPSTEAPFLPASSSGQASLPPPRDTPSACEELSGEREDRGHADKYRARDQGCMGLQRAFP